jgi:uncharacterized membrane protein YdjX (TVP38/TMEM64 family)
MQSGLRSKISRGVALLFVIALSLVIYSYRDKVQELAIFGYPGIFIISFLAYATVFLPAPGITFIFTMGAIFNPLTVTITAGTGAALGEISGYLAGFGGQAVIENVEVYNKLTSWMKRYGSITILILAAVPNPFFDIAGVAAGALKMPFKQFIIFCWLGELIKMAFFAFAGAGILNKFFF